MASEFMPISLAVEAVAIAVDATIATIRGAMAQTEASLAVEGKEMPSLAREVMVNSILTWEMFADNLRKGVML